MFASKRFKPFKITLSILLIFSLISYPGAVFASETNKLPGMIVPTPDTLDKELTYPVIAGMLPEPGKANTELIAKDSVAENLIEVVDEEIEYPPMLDPSVPPEKALSEDRRIYMKHVRHMPKIKNEKPASFISPDNNAIPSQTLPVKDTENDSTVTAAVYKIGQPPMPNPNNLKTTTESVVRNVYSPDRNSLLQAPPFELKDIFLDIDKSSPLLLETESVVQNVYPAESRDNDFPIKNKEGLYKVGFSLKSGKDLLRFSYGDASLLLSPVDSLLVIGKVYKNSILYEDIYPDIDLRYAAEKNRLKEDIILKKYTGKTDFCFQMSVSNAVYYKTSDGKLHFFEPRLGSPLFYMDKPYAVDKKGDRFEKIKIDVTTEGLLKISIDPEWLKKAVYPVIIDPTIYLNNAVFTRSTTAYMQCGYEVAANQPRYETGIFGQAVMVEEQTTNLASNPSFENYTGNPDDGTGDTFTGWYAYSEGTGRNEAVTDKYYSGYAVKLVQTSAPGATYRNGLYQERLLSDVGLSPGDNVSISFKYKCSCQTSACFDAIICWYDQLGNFLSSNVIVTEKINEANYITAKLENVTVPGNAYKFRIIINIISKAAYSSGNNWATLDGILIERKKHTSSFYDSNRAAEFLTIPTAGVFSPAEGTWEQMVYINSMAKRQSGSYNAIFEIPGSDGAYCILLAHRPSTSDWILSFRNQANDVISSVIDEAFTPDGYHRFSVKWTVTEAKLLIDGVVRATISNPPLYAAFGPRASVGYRITTGGDHLSTLHDDLRISSIARSDADIMAAYNSGQPLPEDQYTTFKMNFDGASEEVNSNTYGAGIRPYWNYINTNLGGGWGISVNTYNFNLILGKTLFQIPGRGLPISESITYNSLDDRSRPLGKGWRLGSYSSILEYPDGNVLYTGGDGSTYTFTPNGSGAYNSPPGIYLTLKKADGKFSITDKSFNVYTYDNEKPQQVADRDNNTTTWVYDTNGRLWKLRDTSCREITYT